MYHFVAVKMLYRVCQYLLVSICIYCVYCCYMHKLCPLVQISSLSVSCLPFVLPIKLLDTNIADIFPAVYLRFLLTQSFTSSCPFMCKYIILMKGSLSMLAPTPLPRPLCLCFHILFLRILHQL